MNRNLRQAIWQLCGCRLGHFHHNSYFNPATIFFLWTPLHSVQSGINSWPHKVLIDGLSVVWTNKPSLRHLRLFDQLSEDCLKGERGMTNYRWLSLLGIGFFNIGEFGAWSSHGWACWSEDVMMWPLALSCTRCTRELLNSKIRTWILRFTYTLDSS